MSQAELAAKVGMHRNAISRVERLAEARMHPSNYRALAAALGYEPGQLDFLWRHGDRMLGDEATIAHATDVPAPQWLLDHFGIDDPDAYLALAPFSFDRSRHHVGDLGDRVLVSPRSPMNRSGLVALVEITVPSGHVRRYIGECYQERYGVCIKTKSGIEIRTPPSDIRAIHRVIALLQITRYPEPAVEKSLRLVIPPAVESTKKKRNRGNRKEKSR